MILKKHCPICNKSANKPPEIVDFGGLRNVKYECGHTEITLPLKEVDYRLTSLSGKKSFDYQVAGARFIADANGRALIADEMGLGKTNQFLMFCKAHLDEIGGRFLVICKSGLKVQWTKETMDWCGNEWMPQILHGEHDFILPVRGFIVSMDMLRRFKDIPAWVMRLKISLVCIDEVQAIKNHESKRTNAVRSVVKDIDHVVGLSGTPIKNHAGEYFPILNILKPERYPSLNRFYHNEVDTYFDGYKYKVAGLKDPARFQERNKDFILRRTREDVSDEIQLKCGNQPFRQFRFSDLGKEVENMYALEMKKFMHFMLVEAESMSSLEFESNRLAYLSRMRHLAGIAKIDPCVEFVEEFIAETDRKIVIFLHHKDVAESLRQKLEERRQQWTQEWGSEILNLTSDLDGNARAALVDRFALPDRRVLVASTLASGEGLNLQFCSDCVLLERQWNPANEEQAEARFIRIGQLASRVNATYLVAIATVDEFFSEIVERKRAIVANTLDGVDIKWEESSLMRELTETIMLQGGKRWNL